jgi:hypothetical protein
MPRPISQNTKEIRAPKAFVEQAGKGRPKGVPNKMTAQVKEMILAALEKAGGVDYLVAQADENPTAFMSLVGKVLPLQLTGADGGAIQHEHRHEQVIRSAEQFKRRLLPQSQPETMQ